MNPECSRPVEPIKEVIENEQNTVEVETKNANYNILFNFHGLPIKPEMIPQSDAFVLEGITDYEAVADQKENYFYNPLSKASVFDRTARLYQNIITKAKEDGTPVFLVDLSEQNHKTSKFAPPFIIMGLEILLGAGLIGLSAVEIAKIRKNEPISRRDFIKKAAKIAGGLSFGAYLGGPAALRILTNISTEYYMVKPSPASVSTMRLTQEIEEKSKKVYPFKRSFAIDTRNELIAQKAETVARILKNETGNRTPNISLPIGLAHSEIVECLQKTEEQRIQQLKNDLKEEFQNEGQIVRLDFLPPLEKGGEEVIKVTILEDPAFKA